MAATRSADSRHAPDAAEAPKARKSILATLWSYRRTLAAAAVVTIVVAGAICLLWPTGGMARLRFRLLFEGANEGKYPSGVRFGYTEIIARPILHEVYDSNSISQYGEPEDFLKAFVVSATPSAEMEVLDSEYASKLVDRKLTAVDRTRLEKEYRERRAGLLGGVGYSLSMDLSRDVTGSIPEDRREKVLRDVLARWAENAARRKGAISYQIAVMSEKILPKETILGSDHLIAADMLRLKLKTILKNIDELLKLPGAKSFRTDEGKLSLAEVRADLTDMLRFRLVPAMQLIGQRGLSDKPDLAGTYIQSRIYDITISKQASTEKVEAMRKALLAYSQNRAAVAAEAASTSPGSAAPEAIGGAGGGVPAMIPQFGESFLDRIVEMATLSDDLKFRQDFTERITTEALKAVDFTMELQVYEDLLKTAAGPGPDAPQVAPAQRAADIKTIKEWLSGVYEQLVKTTSQVQAIHEELSAKNLNPPTELYSAPEPVEVRGGLRVRERLGYWVVMVIAAVLVVAVVCLFHDRLGRKADASD